MGRYPYFQSQPMKEEIKVVSEMLRLTDISAFENRHDNSLSGGEKQRVHLARVLVQMQHQEGNKLLSFDEPLNNLDVRHQYHILKVIKNFVQAGNTGVLMLHDLNLAAQFADRLLLLRQGKTIAYGRPEEVLTELLIQKAYDFPCWIMPHPITQQPMIIFGW